MSCPASCEDDLNRRREGMLFCVTLVMPLLMTYGRCKTLRLKRQPMRSSSARPGTKLIHILHRRFAIRNRERKLYRVSRQLHMVMQPNVLFNVRGSYTRNMGCSPEGTVKRA